jgi:hypothetical protein
MELVQNGKGVLYALTMSTIICIIGYIFIIEWWMVFTIKYNIAVME